MLFPATKDYFKEKKQQKGTLFKKFCSIITILKIIYLYNFYTNGKNHVNIFMIITNY
jgi:hypothetical protein